MASVGVNVIALLAVCASTQKLRGGADPKATEFKKAEASALKSGCHGSLCDTLPENHFAVLMDQGNVVITIGVFDSKNETEKCVTHPTPVTCEDNAANQGHRLNNKNMEYDDEFSVVVKGGTQVCVRRVDRKEGWGQELKIACKDSQEKKDKCMCLTSMEGDCACKGCTEEEQKQTCGELLGPCTCQRSEEGICDCHGYCHTREHRQGACEDEPGCSWSGMWCEAQVGLLWS